jgi:sulfite reductase beta subunit-like hemoprotein
MQPVARFCLRRLTAEQPVRSGRRPRRDRRALTPLIERYVREPGERFGDFVIRKGYAASTISWREFHINLSAELAA